MHPATMMFRSGITCEDNDDESFRIGVEKGAENTGATSVAGKCHFARPSSNFRGRRAGSGMPVHIQINESTVKIRGKVGCC